MHIVTGVLEGDPLALFLFIIFLDYALRISNSSNDGLTLKHRRTSRYPVEVLADLDYPDDIMLLEDFIESGQDLFNRVDKAGQDVELFVNIP